MQRKTWYVLHFGVGRHASFLQKPVVKNFKKRQCLAFGLGHLAAKL
jgi:hypothetical protein